MKKHFEVVAALVINEGEILCVQRGISKYDYISKQYEFPCGKMDNKGLTIKQTVNYKLKSY